MMWGLVLLIPGVVGLTGPLLSEETLARRTLTRFMKNHSDHAMCWERHGVDGFFSMIDTHNHFRPFSGPSVPFLTYLDWMINHGILFSTMFGIGQKIVKTNTGDPECCYYLHCPNLNYTVVPTTDNDVANAQDYTTKYKGNPSLEEKVHLTLSLTFPNLQQPKQLNNNLNRLQNQFPNIFKWAGEINVFKHALASNGFFEQDRVTEKMIEEGKFDRLFETFSAKRWPTTLHCDLGCDNYNSVPVNIDPRNRISGCEVTPDVLRQARAKTEWWRSMLGPYYYSFFNKQNVPRESFSKVQHLGVWDALLTRYKDLQVVWAHLGLSKELHGLHPYIHTHVLRTLFNRHPNLHADVSWDVLAKQNLMNHESGRTASHLSHEEHTDFNADTEFLVNSSDIDAMRQDLHDTWQVHEDLVRRSGSISGPSHSMAVYLELFHEFPDRFLTGTDFVASYGPKADYPGTLNKNGCVKDVPNHARQLTDTSSINMFFQDEAFRKIVLGENFFRLTGLSDIYAAPPVCGDSVLPLEAIIGIGVGVGLLFLLIIIILLSIYFCRRDEGGAGSGGGAAFTRVTDGDNPSATTNV